MGHIVAYLKSTIDGANVHETPNGKVIDAVGPLQKLHVGREEKTRATVWTHVYYDRNGGPQQSGWIARKLLSYHEVTDLPDLSTWETEGGAVAKDKDEFKGNGDRIGAVLAALVGGGILIAVILRSIGVI